MRSPARGTGSRWTLATTFFPSGRETATSIVSGSVRTTTFVDLYQTFLGSPQGREELLLSTAQPKFPMDWSADGRFLRTRHRCETRVRPGGAAARARRGRRAKGVRGGGNGFQRESRPVLPDRTVDRLSVGQDRPALEIYVRPFPGPAVTRSCPMAGGIQVRWNPNGKELFYIGPDDRLMAVPITFSADGRRSNSARRPRCLPRMGREAPNLHRHQYAVSPDGNSFVMHTVVGEASSPHLRGRAWRTTRGVPRPGPKRRMRFWRGPTDRRHEARSAWSSWTRAMCSTAPRRRIPPTESSRSRTRRSRATCSTPTIRSNCSSPTSSRTCSISTKRVAAGACCDGCSAAAS